VLLSSVKETESGRLKRAAARDRSKPALGAIDTCCAVCVWSLLCTMGKTTFNGSAVGCHVS
jgi:hypothetical protein